MIKPAVFYHGLPNIDPTRAGATPILRNSARCQKQRVKAKKALLFLKKKKQKNFDSLGPRAPDRHGLLSG
jgi:hypothetical protein